MGLKALFYAYVLGGITFIPLLVAGFIFFTIYTSVPLGDADLTKKARGNLEARSSADDKTPECEDTPTADQNDIPRTRKGWLTVRRTFEEPSLDGGYVTIVRSFLDSRSKDPKRSRPKDMWYVVLKGKVLYLYEDEGMTECEAAVELSSYDVVIYPESLPDGELFAKRNAICLKPSHHDMGRHMSSLTKEMTLSGEDVDAEVEQKSMSPKRQEKQRGRSLEEEKLKLAAREEALNPFTPWFIFVRSNIEMEDWYLALIHASDHPSKTSLLAPLLPIFLPSDMNHLVSNLDEQPDVIPTRWLNALIGRLFFSYYRTHALEAYIISRLMKKLSKVKRPNFLTDIIVTEVSVGSKAPTFSKPMLKELTKEGDAAMEVHFQYKGEFRITIEAIATLSLGTFRTYTVKLVLAVVLKELEGNILIKVKRPPSNRIWYAFTQTPRMVLEVEPIVSDRQITWGMILSTIESRLKEIIQESVVMPNMDDIAFFDSSNLRHRGGIFQDATRREKPMMPPADAEHTLTDETQSIISAPTEDTSPIVEDIATAPVSRSADELSVPPPVTEPPSALVNDPTMEEPSGSSTMHSRRRSWFSSIRNEGSPAKIGLFPDVGDDLDIDVSRGRSTELDKGNTRSRSTPGNSESTQPTQNQESDDSSLLSANSSIGARRSSSQHSERPKSVFTDSSAGVPDSTQTRKSFGSTPSTPNSFLSTLKSRAGDKQALGNTAKEAMRKLGVSWGMRKEASGDDVSDHGSIGSTISSRLRPDSTFGVASKARASYAEVRAAVAERKNKNNGEGGSGTSDGGNPSRPSSPATTPIPIPVPERARAVSNPAGPSKQTSSTTPHSYPEGIMLSSSIDSITSSSSKPKRLSTGEATSGAGKPSTSQSRANTEGDASNQSPKPIHVVQPQARTMTMTIPGIHASHRGEIMSMGYSPPAPPPSIVPPEGKSSLYRLFKSPATSGPGAGDQHISQQLPPSPSQKPPTPALGDSSISQVKDSGSEDAPALTHSSFLSPSHAPSASPTASSHQALSPRVPPPLPPRSLSVNAPAASLSLVGQPAPQTKSPTAAHTLQTIANKDKLSRVSSDNSTGANGNGVNGSPTVNSDIEDTQFAAPESDLLRETPATSSSLAVPKPKSNPGPPLPPRKVPISEAQA